uniref:Uncharacterized protein n=1 Tax=Rhizophora mucronata TaxID=61149 RepID=A0A2P2NIJ4_RHIMU
MLQTQNSAKGHANKLFSKFSPLIKPSSKHLSINQRHLKHIFLNLSSIIETMVENNEMTTIFGQAF